MRASRRKIKAMVEVTTKQGVEHTLGFNDMARGIKAAKNLQRMMRHADPEHSISFTKTTDLIDADGVEEVAVPTLTVRAGEISSVEFTDLELWERQARDFS